MRLLVLLAIVIPSHLFTNLYFCFVCDALQMGWKHTNMLFTIEVAIGDGIFVVVGRNGLRFCLQKKKEKKKN